MAGIQLYIDLDLGHENLPPGTRLQLGEAVIDVTAIPHTVCRKFTARFGAKATRFVNSKQGRQRNHATCAGSTREGGRTLQRSGRRQSQVYPLPKAVNA